MEGLGAKVTNSVSGKTVILVAAANSGANKMEQVEAKGVTVWTEEEDNTVISSTPIAVVSSVVTAKLNS